MTDNYKQNDKYTIAILVSIACVFMFLVGFGMGAHYTYERWFGASVSEPCTCFEERSYFNGDQYVTIWTIENVDYLVRRGEVVGRYERFYREDGRRK